MVLAEMNQGCGSSDPLWSRLWHALGKTVLPLLEIHNPGTRRMPPVTIYTTPLCGYCRMAKQLLAEKAVDFREIDVSRDMALRAEMVAKSGGRQTVPQIWIGDRHVGGCDDLQALEASGQLDPLLAQSLA